MKVQIRQCCCALHTFVRVSCILLSVSHLLAGLAVSVWYHLTAVAAPHNEEQEGNVSAAVVLAITLVFCFLGVAVNLLVLLGIHKNRRSLLLPWLVFHLMVILGCFAVGLYIGLHYTVLAAAAPQQQHPHQKQQQQQEPDEPKREAAFAVLCLFPLVTGIFLIFEWILVDQLFIQMRTMKQLGIKSVSSSNLSQLRNNMVVNYNNDDCQKAYGGGSIAAAGGGGQIVVVAPPAAAAARKLQQQQQSVQQQLMKMEAARRQRAASTISMAYQTQSLPRPPAKERRHKIREFSYRLDFDPLKMKRAKSLEHILDSGSSSTSSSAFSAANIWVADKRQHQSEMLPPPSGFSTIDRARLRQRQHSQTLQPRRPMHRQHIRVVRDTKRSHSAERGEESDGSSNRGHQLYNRSIELRRASSEHAGLDKQPPQKCVKIHPRVTEFHYPGDAEDERQEDSIGDVEVMKIPEPIFPSLETIDQQQQQQQQQTTGKSWLAKLNPKAKLSFTKDQIIDFYCQVGDVQL